MAEPDTDSVFGDDDVGAASTTCSRQAKPTAPPKKWDDACVKKILCKDSGWVIAGINKRAKHVVRASGHWPDETWDSKAKKWVVSKMGMGGQWDPGSSTLTVQDDATCESAAVAIYHEATHAGQPPSMSGREMEYDAYTKTELWAIARGLPSQHPSYRTKDKSGNVVPDVSAIKRRVDAQYPGAPEGPAVSTTIGGKTVMAQYEPVDYDPVTFETILAVPNSSQPQKRRPPQDGDRVARDLVYDVAPTDVGTKAWKCP